MSRGNNRHIIQRSDGVWANTVEGRKRATSLHETQADAVRSARNALRNAGGGELIIHGADGKVRQKDTVPPMSYDVWRESRVHTVTVAGIDIRLRIVSPSLLRSSAKELPQQIIRNENSLVHGTLTRREFAQATREVLDLLLPYILISPDWLPKALDDFNDSEVIELYNLVMHDVDISRARYVIPPGTDPLPPKEVTGLEEN